jgi:hypothetical protein
MSQAAHVTSIEAVKQFHQALCGFCKEAADALCAVELDVRRSIEWLQHDRLGFWMHQVRQGRECVAQARTDLQRVKLGRLSGRVPDCIEQQKALWEAQRRLEEAEQKVQLIQRWARTLQRAVDEYRAKARRLAGLVEGNPPAIVAPLDHTIAALDAYARKDEG